MSSSTYWQQVARCARELARCRLTGSVVGPSLTHAPTSTKEAYAVQRALHEQLAQADCRFRRVGHKVGCTSGVMQRYLDIPHPCAGGIFERSLWRQEADGPPPRVALSAFRSIGLECEIAAVLAKPLSDSAKTLEEAADAVGSVHASVELVDDRYEDWKSGRPSKFAWMADDFFGAGLVLGPPLRLPSRDFELLGELRGTFHAGGELVGAGSGRDIIDGNPLGALLWLAGSGALPGGLPAGHIITLGSICKTVWLGESPSSTLVEARFSLPGADGGDEGALVGSAALLLE